MSAPRVPLATLCAGVGLLGCAPAGAWRDGAGSPDGGEIGPEDTGVVRLDGADQSDDEQAEDSVHPESVPPGDGDDAVGSAEDSGEFTDESSCSGDPCTIGWTRTAVAGRRIAVDSRGHVYLAGAFASDTDFDPSDGTDVRHPAGRQDGFVLHLDERGGYVGVGVLGGSAAADDLTVADVVVAPDDRLYVGGLLKGSADLDPGPGMTEVRTAGEDPSGWTEHAIFVVRLAPALSADWIRHFYTYTNFEMPSDLVTMAVDRGENVILAGYYWSLVWSGDPGLRVDSYGIATFLARFTSGGALAWLGGQRTDPTTGFCRPSGLAATSADELSVSGECPLGYTVDLDFGRGEDWQDVPNRFLTRLRSDGAYRWTILHDLPAGCPLLAPIAFGNILLGCSFRGEADLDPGSAVDRHVAAGGGWDGYVNLFDAGFRRAWTWTSGYPSDDRLAALATDGDDRIYVALSVAEGTLLVALTDAGEVLWERPFPGTVEQIVARTPHGLFLRGWFTSAGDFDPGPAGDLRAPAGSWDTFVTRLAASGTY